MQARLMSSADAAPISKRSHNNRPQPHTRMLFQHLPYGAQEPLNLSEQDVAAVVEVRRSGLGLMLSVKQ